ncbi:acyltransferase family protein [Microbacterium sp. dk485]|uniref:acyltransferase family protein n=1 Tax=Microbacterium sp. dk485 TaxID=2560021 RepID=UPI002476537D|nr:acyltransferase family protein [Microbacterium sp. dk485]
MGRPPLTTASRVARSTAERSAFRSDIQGLRALAVLLVLLYHAGLPFVPGGYVGVDVFFVISGFLITGHLAHSLDRTGRIDLPQFYARRVRRILPASLVVVVLTVVGIALFVPVVDAVRVLKDALATVLYVPNIWFALQQTDYLADHAASPFQHYWSLGVEEQFYLLWPLVLWLIVVLVRRHRSGAVAAVAVLTVLSAAAGVWLTAINQPYAFFLLPTRAWELFVGALIALLARSDLLARVPPTARAASGWLGLGAVIVAGAVFDEATPFPGTAAITPVVGTALILAAGSVPTPGGPGRLLSIRPARFLGLISYSLYLVHWPLLVVPQSAVGFHRPLPLWITVLLGVVLAVPLAWLLHRIIEEPLRAPGALTSRPAKVTVWGALIATAVVAAVIVATIAWADRREVPAVDDAPTAASFPVSPPPATSALPGNLAPSLDAVSADVPVLYADGCHHDVSTEVVQDCLYGPADAATRIALFGDSHSAQWFPAVQALAKARGDTSVAAYTKSSCPAVDVTVVDKDVAYAGCDRWRDAVLAALVGNPPDLVVISSYSGYRLAGHSGGERVSAWADGTTSVVSALRAAGSEVMMIADTPRFTSAPATCIATVPNDVLSCAGDPATALDRPLAAAETAAATAAGAVTVNMTDFLCDRDRCPVIIDDLLVYRDINHLTVRAVGYLTPALQSAFDRALSAR